MKNVVIMAGGRGTRLWPLSRNNSPKQLQNLVGKNSMIQDTYERLKTKLKDENIYVSTNDYKKQISKQLPNIPNKNYIIEPMAKDTAPAIGLIAAKIAKTDPNAIITTLASDHIVKDNKKFISAIEACQKMVEENPKMIGTIGLTPTSPHTGYGYIQRDRLIKKDKNLEVFKVKNFKEKPDLKTAKEYVKTKKYYWNASYFTFNVSSLLEYFKKYQPKLYKHLEKIKQAVGTKNENSVIKKEFEKIEKLAIDYLIEDIPQVFVIPVEIGWDDIGSWKVLKDIVSKNNTKQVVKRGNSLGIDNKDCLIYAQDRLIATIGLENIVIVDTNDATLICHKDRTQDVKNIVNELKKDKNRKKYL